MNKHSCLLAGLLGLLLATTPLPLRGGNGGEVTLGWYFEVGWPDMAPWDPAVSLVPLPDRFNWNEEVGEVPIRAQGCCGSCWAFATLGTVEYQVLIQHRKQVDLSEQWLVSCNRDGWSCTGGFLAYNYLMRNATEIDLTGARGAVLEVDFPYEKDDVACPGPLPRHYFLEGWNYIGISGLLTTVTQIKNAIRDRGPILCSVYVNEAFKDYGGGVFQDGEDGLPNHSILLIGWDDSRGENGCWRLRNSWGPNWGEGGYMWIPYDSSMVGFGANYPILDRDGRGIWVDDDHAGPETGIYQQPYNTISEGLSNLADGGTLSLKAGTYNVADGTRFTKPMIVMGHKGRAIVK